MSRILEGNESSPAMAASDELDEQPRATSVSAREILPMKRHLLSAAASIHQTREPFITSGAVTSVLGTSPPRPDSSPGSPHSSFPSPPNSLDGESRPTRAPLDLPYKINETEYVIKQQVPAVSETVRQMLSSPQLRTIPLGTQLSPMLAQSSSPTNRAVSHNGQTLNHCQAEGPELFAGMDDDDE